jgi:hypothetical protein
MRGVAITLAIGLLGAFAIVGVVLAEHPLTLIATNSTSASQELDVTGHGVARGCQGGELLPGGTRAIRISLEAFTGPSMRVTALSGSRVITSGSRGSGWSAATVTVGVKTVSQTVRSARICFTSGEISEPMTVYGSNTSPAIAARSGQGVPLAGRFRVEYLGRADSSWLAMVSSVARHMGLGRAWSGTWVAWWVLVLTLVTAGLASYLALRELHE